MSSDMLSYDATIRIAHFVPDYFDVPEVVEIIRWQVKGGSRVRAGTLLAEIYWNDGTFEEMKCPQGCSGTLAATNRRIEYFQLPDLPPQFAYRME